MPNTFADLVDADLKRATGLVRKCHPDPIDPQFRIASPEGDLWLGITLPDDTNKRLYIFRLISDLMALKQSPAFTFACELAEPDAVYCAGVSFSDTQLRLSTINRQPLSFSKSITLDPAQLDPQIKNLLARGALNIQPDRLSELQKWFGPSGKFPVLSVASFQAVNLT